jgi:RNA polymerase sigma-70 factor (ECF subfamily)
LQEIFIKVFTHLKDIQRVETFPGWLYRIAVNTCYSYLRQNKTELQKKVPLSEVEAEMKQPEGESPESYLKKPLDEAIEVLPKKLKSVFLLHDVQGFKHREISRMLGCSVGTSKSQLFKARLKIRNVLRDKKIL